MTEQRVAVAGCTGKRPYDTHAKAVAAIERHKSKPEYKAPSSESLKPYHCEHCSAWHIGHSYPEKP